MSKTKVLVNYIQKEKYDELYTPDEGVYPIIPYLKNRGFKTIWECTDFGGSNITKILKQEGFNVVTSHIKEDKSFFDYEPSDYDCIVTNPPYSIKDDFLERAYSLNKPFALLLPITSLEGIRRGKMYVKYGVEVLVLDKRLNFMKKEGKKSNWFNTSWFCNDVLPESLLFFQIT